MASALTGRVVVVGAGEVAESYWLPGAALLQARVEVIDIDHDRARALAERSGPAVRAAGSLAEARPTAEDIVVVATPPATHGMVVREALGAGARRMMVEKPPFASAIDMEQTLSAAAEHDTAIGVAFVRRTWRPVVAARRLFPTWRHRFGALTQVRIAEGRPYAWRSRATDERGIAGLSGMFLDELPHPLDGLFRITGWTGAADGHVEHARLDPLEVDVSLGLAGEDGPIDLRILGSRIAQMPNTLELGFERGAVTVEMQPNGGIVVRPDGDDPALIRCDGMDTGVETMFASMLADISRRPLSGSPDGLETWRGPLALIELVGAEA